MATTTVASLLALVERPDIWAHIACHLGGDELWRARRVNRGLRSACEAELRELNLSSYTAVTDEGLRAVAAACTPLTSLDLGWCEMVTDEGLRAVAAACTQLSGS